MDVFDRLLAGGSSGQLALEYDLCLILFLTVRRRRRPDATSPDQDPLRLMRIPPLPSSGGWRVGGEAGGGLVHVAEGCNGCLLQRPKGGRSPLRALQPLARSGTHR